MFLVLILAKFVLLSFADCIALLEMTKRPLLCRKQRDSLSKRLKKSGDNDDGDDVSLRALDQFDDKVVVWEATFSRSALASGKAGNYFQTLFSSRWCSPTANVVTLRCDWLLTPQAWKTWALCLRQSLLDDTTRFALLLDESYYAIAYTLYHAFLFFQQDRLVDVWPGMLRYAVSLQEFRQFSSQQLLYQHDEWLQLQTVLVLSSTDDSSPKKTLLKFEILHLNLWPALLEEHKLVVDAQSWLNVLCYVESSCETEHGNLFVDVLAHFGNTGPLEDCLCFDNKTYTGYAKTHQPVTMPRNSVVVLQEEEVATSVCVQQRDAFFHNMDTFTHHVLDEKTWQTLPWHNTEETIDMIVAGGAIVYAAAGASCFQNPEAYIDSDIDFWICGNSGDGVLTPLLKHLGKCCEVITSRCKTLGYGKAVLVRDGYANTLYVTGLARRFQFMLVLDKLPAHVVCDFDLNYLMAYHDGQRLYALPSCLNAWQTRITSSRQDGFLPHEAEPKPLLPLRRILKTWSKGFMLQPIPETWHLIEHARKSNGLDPYETYREVAARPVSRHSLVSGYHGHGGSWAPRWLEEVSNKTDVITIRFFLQRHGLLDPSKYKLGKNVTVFERRVQASTSDECQYRFVNSRHAQYNLSLKTPQATLSSRINSLQFGKRFEIKSGAYMHHVKNIDIEVWTPPLWEGSVGYSTYLHAPPSDDVVAFKTFMDNFSKAVWDRLVTYGHCSKWASPRLCSDFNIRKKHPFDWFFYNYGKRSYNNNTFPIVDCGTGIVRRALVTNAPYRLRLCLKGVWNRGSEYGLSWQIVEAVQIEDSTTYNFVHHE